MALEKVAPALIYSVETCIILNFVSNIQAVCAFRLKVYSVGRFMHHAVCFLAVNVDPYTSLGSLVY